MKEIYLLLATKEYISVTVVSSMNNECPNKIVNIGNLIHPMILNQMIRRKAKIKVEHKMSKQPRLISYALVSNVLLMYLIS